LDSIYCRLHNFVNTEFFCKHHVTTSDQPNKRDMT
jgi:hypothetical protein